MVKTPTKSVTHVIGDIQDRESFSKKTKKSIVTSSFRFDKVKHRQVYFYNFANSLKHLYRSDSIFVTTRNIGKDSSYMIANVY